MPKKTQTVNPLAGKAGQKAFRGHRGDDTTFSGNLELPSGIKGGVARLTSCEFGTFETGDLKGKPYFRAAADIVFPKRTEGGVKLEGRKTSIMEPLCATPGRKRATFDDHVAWVLNALRLLGVDTSDLDAEDLPAVMADLVEDGEVYTGFETWSGKPTKQFPNPRVNETWTGMVEYDAESEDDDDDVEEDDTEEDTEVEEEEDAESEEEEEAEEEDEDSEEEDEDEDSEDDESMSSASLKELGEAADDGDEEATAELQTRARAAGMKSKKILGYDTWAELSEELEANSDEDEEEETEESEDEETEDEEDDSEESLPPEKDGVGMYKPPRKRKPVECEVTAVFKNKKTCNLRSLADGRMYKGVAWSDLQLD